MIGRIPDNDDVIIFEELSLVKIRLVGSQPKAISQVFFVPARPVLLLHSVPDYVAGDLLVESDGATLEWFFATSKFIAHLDEHFDYKCERKERLQEIKKKRWKIATF